MSKKKKQTGKNGREVSHCFTKPHVFLYTLIIIAILSLAITIHFDNWHYIKMHVEKQATPIYSIYQHRNTTWSSDFWMGTINFPPDTDMTIDGTRAGLTKNFYADLSTIMNVQSPGTYTFTVTSDDGFQLLIDGLNVSDYSGTRAMNATTATVNLTKGNHILLLHYFQAGGSLGLQAYYTTPNGATHYIGDSSSAIIFRS